MLQSHPTERSSAIAVRAVGLRRVFEGDVAALDGVDLDIRRGEFLAILGPSGCGKSTLLRMIAGLDRPTAGQIDFIGDFISAGLDYRGAGGVRVGFVFQDAHLLPWRNLLRNVALPLELAGRNGTAPAAAAIRQVGLADAAQRYPAQLSGGMRMRGSLARALVNDPQLLLLDEPFAALDEITRQQLDDQLRALWLARGMTVLFVTHSIIEAAFLADRAIVLSRRPGRIVLDHALNLPRERTPELRTDPGFAREMRVLFEALRSGGAA